MILLPFVAIDYVPLTSMQLVYLILAGIASAVGQFCVTTAYKYAAAKDISIYSYASVIFSAVLGALLFEQYPDVELARLCNYFYSKLVYVRFNEKASKVKSLIFAINFVRIAPLSLRKG